MREEDIEHQPARAPTGILDSLLMADGIVCTEMYPYAIEAQGDEPCRHDHQLTQEAMFDEH
ncbi:hypothetical protein [Allokutzneria oryzae]|uniref:Uncharacterized protein n=1 Tax=Allokutzneria oryzae TaxID=1378989 RepID=A0ABV6A6Q7_9PSEU